MTALGRSLPRLRRLVLTDEVNGGWRRDGALSGGRQSAIDLPVLVNEPKRCISLAIFWPVRRKRRLPPASSRLNPTATRWRPNRPARSRREPASPSPRTRARPMTSRPPTTRRPTTMAAPKNKEEVLAQINLDGLPNCPAEQILEICRSKYEPLVHVFIHYCKFSDCKTMESSPRLKLGARTALTHTRSPRVERAAVGRAGTAGRRRRAAATPASRRTRPLPTSPNYSPQPPR